MAARDGVRKFAAAGELLWHYETPAPMSRIPSLWRDSIYGQTDGGHVFALQLDSGAVTWLVRPGRSAGSDCANVGVNYGVMVVSLDDASSVGGSLRVLGLNATDGRTLWAYDAGFSGAVVVYNFLPLFTRKPYSCLFMDSTGGVRPPHGYDPCRQFLGSAVPQFPCYQVGLCFRSAGVPPRTIHGP